MKTKDWLLLAGLAVGGYFVYKEYRKTKGEITGASDAIGGVIETGKQFISDVVAAPSKAAASVGAVAGGGVGGVVGAITNNPYTQQAYATTAALDFMSATRGSAVATAIPMDGAVRYQPAGVPLGTTPTAAQQAPITTALRAVAATTPIYGYTPTTGGAVSYTSSAGPTAAAAQTLSRALAMSTGRV